MRRDTQIGVILGIVILVIIGVFLGTRTDVNEPQISDLVLSQQIDKQHQEIEEININDLISKSESAQSKETAPIKINTEQRQLKEKSDKSIPLDNQPSVTDEKTGNNLIETTKDSNSLKGKWEGMPEAIQEKPEIYEKSQIAEELHFADEQENIKETLSEKNQQVLSVDISAKTMYTVKPNDNLFKISKEYFGDESKWNKIFEANRASMSDPHSLYVGQKLIIPGITVNNKKPQSIMDSVEKKPKPGKTVNATTHTVQPGDTLYRIAGKYYGDSAMWEKIFEANEDKLENEGLLINGQILIIPK